MTPQFVDTNVFLRHLTKDDPQKARACFELFKKAERDEVALTTSEAIIAEVVYVLSSKRTYNLPHETIKKCLYPLLCLKGFRLPHQQAYLRALELYGTHKMDFEDCLALAHMERQQLKEIYSYDQEFNQVANIKRIEP